MDGFVNVEKEPLDLEGEEEINKEIESRIRELDDENIDFTINVNNMIGNLGPKNFHAAINAISTALFILQKERTARHIFNINFLANRVLKTQSILHCSYELNRAETISLLYYIHQNMETITMNTEAEEIPTWSIREDIFRNLCEL